ncbi:hypothetical protein ACS0TY_008913 [Phlomoides rotata]
MVGRRVAAKPIAHLLTLHTQQELIPLTFLHGLYPGTNQGFLLNPNFTFFGIKVGDTVSKLKNEYEQYNEHDQPICRVCDVVLKSEPHWLGHQASRKHHEAIEKFKARDAALNRYIFIGIKERDSGKFRDPNLYKKDSDSAKTQVAEALISGSETDKSYTATSTQMGNPEVLGSKDFRQVETGLESKQVKGALPVGFFDDKDSDLCARRVTPVKPDVK